MISKKNTKKFTNFMNNNVIFLEMKYQI